MSNVSDQFDRPDENGGDRPAAAVWVYPLAALFVWGVALVLFLWFFAAARIILLGLLGAGTLAAMMFPLARRIPGPRWLGAILAGAVPIFVAAGIVALAVWLLREPLMQELNQWPQIRQQINATLANYGDRLNLSSAPTVRSLSDRALAFMGDSGVASTTADVISNTFLAIVFFFVGALYMMGEREGRILSMALALLPQDRRPQLRGAVDDLAPRLRWWLIGTLISMTVVGVASWIGYWAIGLRFAVAVALLAGISEVVPTIGPLVTYLVALLLAATQGAGMMLGVTAVYLVVQLLESYVLLPYVMKRAVKIPPLVTLFSIVLWGAVFGPAGLLLALPLDLTIYTILDRFVIAPRHSG